MSIDGIDVVGPFPEPYQKHTDFSAAIFTDSDAPELAEAFLDHLSDETAAEVYARCGLLARTRAPRDRLASCCSTPRRSPWIRSRRRWRRCGRRRRPSTCSTTG